MPPQVAPEFNVKDSVLFVIDARKAMCERGPGGGPSCFQQSLSCVLKCMEDRILGGERDLVGVLLFGTEKTKVPNGHQSFHHVYVLQELEEPSAASMRTVSLICAGEEAARAEGGGGSSAAAAAATLAAEFGHMEASSPDFDLANALWVTSMLFNSNAVSADVPPHICASCTLREGAASSWRPCPISSHLLASARPLSDLPLCCPMSHTGQAHAPSCVPDDQR
jgi:hypothetical protein